MQKIQKLSAVIGSGYGDEGKGLLTDYLCHQSVEAKLKTLVVRFNGGAQAGHTVMDPSGQAHIFSHFGSGAFLGVPTYFSQHCLINPILFIRESNQLLAKQIKPILFVHPEALVTTPYDMAANQLKEVNREVKHGSCGVGIYETVKRHQTYPFTALDLQRFTKQQFIDKMADIRAYYLDNMEQASSDEKAFFRQDSIVEQFYKDAQEMAKLAWIGVKEFVLSTYEHLIFEGAQGLLLDQMHGEFPHLTPSNTGLLNINDILLKVNPDLDLPPLDVYYVSRSYSTRHGHGPLKNEKSKEELGLVNTEYETNATNQFQGNLRYGELDLDRILHVTQLDYAHYTGDKRLNYCLTCMDQINDAETLKDKAIRKLNQELEVSKFLFSYGPSRQTVLELSY